jgi:hypothetical protein
MREARARVKTSSPARFARQPFEAVNAGALGDVLQCYPPVIAIRKATSGPLVLSCCLAPTSPRPSFQPRRRAPPSTARRFASSWRRMPRTTRWSVQTGLVMARARYRLERFLNASFPAYDYSKRAACGGTCTDHQNGGGSGRLWVRCGPVRHPRRMRPGDRPSSLAETAP